MTDRVSLLKDFPSDFLQLNNNQSSYQIPEEVIEDLNNKLGNINFAKYPNQNTSTLQQWLAYYYKCDSEQILIDNWANKVLETIFRAVLKPWDTVVSPTPSFLLYSYICKLNQVTFLEVDYETNWKFPTEEILDMNADVILISNPNNPTWVYVTPEEIENLLSQTNKLVIVDESYIEFGWESVIPLVKLYPNLIVIRSFASWFQSAGIMIAVAVANPELIHQIKKIQLPFNIDAFKQQYIITMLKYQSEFSIFTKKIKQTRGKFQLSLEELWFDLTNSFGNFVFIYDNKQNISLKNLYEFLKKNKIIIMYYPNIIYDKDYIRITIWTDEEMELVLDKIKNFLKK